jgi:hypothetical protein
MLAFPMIKIVKVVILIGAVAMFGHHWHVSPMPTELANVNQSNLTNGVEVAQ